MARAKKGLQYKLTKEDIAWVFQMYFYFSLLGFFLLMFDYLRGREILMDMFYATILAFVASSLGLLYSYSSRIKTKILTRYGVKHRGEIVRARYGSSGRGTPSYYLEIEFVNSKGKRKTYHSPAYEGDPTSYLENQYCSIYEWKGFYVEADFRMLEEKDNLAWYGPIPTEKKHFIWR